MNGHQPGFILPAAFHFSRSIARFACVCRLADQTGLPAQSDLATERMVLLCYLHGLEQPAAARPDPQGGAARHGRSQLCLSPFRGYAMALANTDEDPALLATGARCIAFTGGIEGRQVTRERMSGYHRVRRDAGSRR